MEVYIGVAPMIHGIKYLKKSVGDNILKSRLKGYSRKSNFACIAQLTYLIVAAHLLRSELGASSKKFWCELGVEVWVVVCGASKASVCEHSPSEWAFLQTRPPELDQTFFSDTRKKEVGVFERQTGWSRPRNATNGAMRNLCVAS